MAALDAADQSVAPFVSQGASLICRLFAPTLPYSGCTVHHSTIKHYFALCASADIC